MNHHPAFELVREQHLASLNITVQEYSHLKTGAQHIHIQADSDENVFLVALRTVPSDSTGVAHILEHTALCGSEKYPVRDPFFMMIRRSLNTFMNAFTSSDWTAYPFASTNMKDFSNLLDVYLDAVFFSRLDELDFLQEGHRLEFEKWDDSSTPLQFKGVVYNEMKGAMSSVPSQLWQSLCKHLHPSNTYHHNSGGDPVEIPNLSYEQLKQFYRTHYHPTNAIFMTFGSIAVTELQQRFENQVLSRFDRLTQTIQVESEQPFSAPLRVTDHYTAEDDDDKSHVVVSWLLGESSDPVEALRAQLMASLLYENSASPLQQLLETSELGKSPSPLNGIEDSQKQIIFVAGMEGCEATHIDAIEAEILTTIQNAINEGFAPERIDACLDQLELQQREVGGDGFPYGLQLILTSLGSATHRGDPIAALDLDRSLNQLRDDLKDPDFVSTTLQRLFIDNPHRLTLCVEPDTQLAEAQNIAEQARLDKISADLSEADIAAIVEQSRQLQARQNAEDDPGSLPKVGIADVPASIHEPARQDIQGQTVAGYQYEAGTNGLVYLQAIITLPELSEAERQILPFMCNILSELGLGNDDYLHVQNLHTACSGGLHAFTSIRNNAFDEQASSGYLVLSGKGLRRYVNDLTMLMQRTLTEVRFDEQERVRDLMSQTRSRKESSVAGNGHAYAMGAATATANGLAAMQFATSGLAGIKATKLLDERLQDPTELASFCDELEQLYRKLTAVTPVVAVVGEQQYLSAYRDALENFQVANQLQHASSWSLPSIRTTNASFWAVNAQVNFCALAFPTVTSAHDDAAALTVLGGVLRNGFLHRALREQGGAYGGGASQDNANASFKFFSYRDPRTQETLDDFYASINWLIDTELSFDKVEESILGVISSLDKPASPAGEAKQALSQYLHGRSPEHREAFRTNVLNVTANELKRVTKKYLLDVTPSVAIVGPKSSYQGFEDSLKFFSL
jgi:hypothetical protein